MKRKIGALIVLGLLTVATAAYAPRSQSWKKITEDAAAYAPCSAKTAFPQTANEESGKKEKYPVPSPGVIGRGHSGQPAR